MYCLSHNVNDRIEINNTFIVTNTYTDKTDVILYL